MRKNKDQLGSRMKRYESVSNILLTPRSPVILRLDGKSFHNYTKNFEKPFSKSIRLAMLDACQLLASEMQGFKLAYTQSDEASFLLTDYDNINTEGWFGYEVQKIVSVASSIFSVSFNKSINQYKKAFFDCRAFNVPRGDVSNYFLWRVKDCIRNSIQSLAQSEFSHKELHGKNCSEIKEMLISKKNDWKDLDDLWKYGSFLFKNKEDLGRLNFKEDPSYMEISRIINPLVDLPFVEKNKIIGEKNVNP